MSFLKKNVIALLNVSIKLKEENMIPSFMNCANVTTVPKRCCRLKLENQRGIFCVSVKRYIIMRLIYNEKHSEINENMSDRQMGGR